MDASIKTPFMNWYVPRKNENTWYTVTLLGFVSKYGAPRPHGFSSCSSLTGYSGTRQNELSIGLWLDPSFPWLNRIFLVVNIPSENLWKHHPPTRSSLLIHPTTSPWYPYYRLWKKHNVGFNLKSNPLRMLNHSQPTRFHNFHYIHLANLKTSMFTILMRYSHPGVEIELSI